MDLQLADRRAIVTGGTKGIGRAIADLLADEGCHVSVCARDREQVDEAVAAIAARGVTAYGEALDVGDRAALGRWIETSASRLDGLDIVVANVSALDMGRGEDAWRNQFEIDLLHTVHAVDTSLPWLERSDAGSIVVISSISGLEYDLASPAYGAIKAALIHYASRLATELAPSHIRVNSVSPGNTYFAGGVWERVEQAMPDVFAASLAKNPWGRMATAEEVATAAVFLASPRASFVTGTNLVVDGALTLGVQY